MVSQTEFVGVRMHWRITNGDRIFGSRVVAINRYIVITVLITCSSAWLSRLAFVDSKYMDIYRLFICSSRPALLANESNLVRQNSWGSTSSHHTTPEVNICSLEKSATTFVYSDDAPRFLHPNYPENGKYACA